MVTLKDIIKTITQSIRIPSTYHYEEKEEEKKNQHLLDVIEQYVDEQTSANISDRIPRNIDPAVIDKFNQDLLHLYQTTLRGNKVTAAATTIVSCQPEIKQLHAQQYSLLRSLRALLPILKPQRIFDKEDSNSNSSNHSNCGTSGTSSNNTTEKNTHLCWWTHVLQPILSQSCYTNSIKREARLIVSDALILEQELVRLGELAEPIHSHRIINIYLDSQQQQQEQEITQDSHYQPVFKNRTTTKETVIGAKEEAVTIQQHRAFLDLEENEWSRNLTTILLSVGASETKQFFIILNRYFLTSRYRLQIVYLLSEFIRTRRTHLHEILDTPLFQSMLKSLMYDNSTTLIAISVTNMIMLLPRMSTSLPPFLPQLFYIFARAICWDQLRDLRKKHSIESMNNKTQTPADGWDCVDYTFSKLSAPPSNPQTGAFFTSLYGLYPCNFLRFLYKPYAYFKENNFTLPEEFDEETFKTRTIPQVSRHLLHPNLVLMDAQTELTDKTRWMKMEPPDVIAQIMALDLTNAASRVAFTTNYSTEKENAVQNSREMNLLDESVWHDDNETTNKEEGDDIIPRTDYNEQKQSKGKNISTITTITSHNKPYMIQNIVTLHKALKSGAEVLIGEDIWDASSEPTSTVTTPTSSNINIPSSSSASSTPKLPSEQQQQQQQQHGTSASFAATASAPLGEGGKGAEDDMLTTESKLHFAALKREVLLLRNELNFELFLKQQHLQHIGRLHRDHVLDTSVEAERQQLYNTNRMLKAQLHQTAAALEKLKSESAMTKQKHIKWEDEQSGKLRGYREARKEWQNQMAIKQHQVSDYEKQLDEQKRQLDKARERIFELENELKTLEPTLKQASGNEHRVQQLTKQMLLWEEDTVHMEEQKTYIKGLLSKWWSMEELVASLQTQNSRLQEEKAQSEELVTKLRIQCADYQHRVNTFSKTFSAGKESVESDKLSRNLKELKQRVETLEIEKLELLAELETVKYANKQLESISSNGNNTRNAEAIIAE